MEVETRTVAVVHRLRENVIEVFRQRVFQGTHGDIGYLGGYNGGSIVTIRSLSNGLQGIVLIAHEVLIHVQAVCHVAGDAHRHEDSNGGD